MFNKKFVSSEPIQSAKDGAALDRLKRLKDLQKQYETPTPSFAGPSIPKSVATTAAKTESSGSEIDEEDLLNMKVPSSDEEESGSEWAEKPSKETAKSTAPISAALLPEDKELTALLDGSSTKREKQTKTKGELQRNMAMLGLAKLANDNPVDRLTTLHEPGSHPKELNPFWKEGGSGLPEEKPEEKKETPAAPPQSSASTDVKWLKRALMRCEQLAKDEGRDLEEVVAERYGSLAELQKQIEDAERKIGTSISARDYKDRNAGLFDDSKQSSSARKGFMNPAKDDRRRDDGRRSDRDRDRRYDDRRDERKDRYDERRSRDYDQKTHRPMRRPDSGSDDRSNSSDEDRSRRRDQRKPPREIGPQPREDRNSNRQAASSLRAQLNFPAARPPPRKDSDDEEEEMARPKQPVSVVDSNKSAAAALRAQLFGGSGGAASSLQSKTEQKSRDEVEVVMRTSKTGLTMPYMASSAAEGATGSRRKLETHTSSGERLRFLPGQDQMSVTDMLAMEKATDAQQQNMLYMRFSGKEKLNDDFDLDDAYVEKASKRKTIEKHEAAEKRRAVAEHKQTSKALSSCTLCLEKVIKHLVVTFGEKSYLAVPQEVNLVEDHCQIIPRDHVKSVTLLEDDGWEEVQLFKKSIYRMFADQGKDVIFMETCMPSHNLGHTIIECFPLEEEYAADAPIYFKKALLESEGLWSDNKKVIDIKGDIRKTVPSGFSYFAVEFGIGGQGYAHIIENEAKFPVYFGKEIIGGMIDCETSLWRRPAKDNIENQLDKSNRLQRMYKKYNWTQQQQQQSNETA